MTGLPLPEITYPLKVDTIGMLIALGDEITAHCNNLGCHHRKRVNLVLLARRLGMDFPCSADRLVPHLYCSRCRDAGRPDRNIGLTLNPCCSPSCRYPRT